MEGWGVLVAATAHQVPVLEVRTVSNLIGDRDPASWDVPVAFAALARVGARLLGDPWR
jgi:futalosine hydrolase